MQMTKAHRRKTLAAVYAATTAVFCDLYAPQPILPVLSREFAVSPATAGLTISCASLGIALASTIYGPLSDLRGRKPVMVGSCALLVLPTMLCAWAPSFAVLLGLRVIQGLLIAGLVFVVVGNFTAQSTTPALVNSEAHTAKGGANALYLAFFYVGGALGAILPGYAWEAWGWPGVAGSCVAALTVGLLADWWLCR